MLNNLLDNGYQAIPCNGKIPIQPGWSDVDHDLFCSPPGIWEKRNVGVRTGRGTIPVYALDIDIYNPDVSEKILRSALKTFGDSPIRTGLAPKAMLFYRAESGQKKIQRKWKDSTGKIHIVEILGYGQQFIAGGIHPDTKQPYSWDRGTIHNIPAVELTEVKHEDIKAWLDSITVPDDWVEIRKKGDLSSRVPDTAELAQRVNATMISRANTVQGGGFTIQQAAQALAGQMDTPARLISYGYKKIGDRFLSPNSSSKEPGVVVFDDGRWYSHHSSDHGLLGLMCEAGGVCGDQFDLFAQYEHSGDQSAALKTLANQCDPDGQKSRQRDFVENKQAAELEAKIAALPELKTIKQGVVSEEYPVDWPPGLTGDVARYIYNSSRMPVKSFAIAGAIQAIAYLIGNTRYIAESDTALNLYQCLIGATGSGKEDPRKGLKRLFEAVDDGWAKFNRPNYHEPLANGICEGMASGPALLRTLEHQKNLIILNDEYGIQLQIALSNGGASHLKELNKEMLTMYGLGRSYYAGKKYADQKNNIGKINKPYVNLLGTTTPSELAEGLNPAAITSGQLNRIIFTFAEGIGETNFNPDFDIPEVLQERLMAVSADDGANIKDDSKKDSPVVGGGFNLPVSFSPGAFDSYKQLCRDFEIEAKHAERFADLYSRAGEQALRIAGSLAVADGATISEEYLAYAVKYVRYSIVTFSEFLSTDLTESVFDSNVQKALKIISDPRKYSKDKQFGEVCAKGFMPRGKLTKMLKIKGSEVTEVVAYLLESQQIEEGTSKGLIAYRFKT